MNLQELREHAERFDMRELFIWVSIAQALERIAKQLEDGQLSLLEGENIASSLKLIADRTPQ